jgi:hypothetical protein
MARVCRRYMQCFSAVFPRLYIERSGNMLRAAAMAPPHIWSKLSVHNHHSEQQITEWKHLFVKDRTHKIKLKTLLISNNLERIYFLRSMLYVDPRMSLKLIKRWTDPVVANKIVTSSGLFKINTDNPVGDDFTYHIIKKKKSEFFDKIFEINDTVLMRVLRARMVRTLISVILKNKIRLGPKSIELIEKYGNSELTVAAYSVQYKMQPDYAAAGFPAH